MKSAITLALFPEAKGGPFVICGGLAEGFERGRRVAVRRIVLAFMPIGAMRSVFAQVVDDGSRGGDSLRVRVETIAALGQLRAKEAFQKYLALKPDAPDAPRIKEYLVEIDR